jgi:hypothetical protein
MLNDLWIPRDLDGTSKALYKLVLVSVNKVEKFCRCCHDKKESTELDQVALLVIELNVSVSDKRLISFLTTTTTSSYSAISR